MTGFFKVPSLTALFICGSLSAISPQLLAATINVPSNLIVSEVNDKAIENGFINKKSSFDLPPGNHTLVLRYKDVFEDLDFAEERLIESPDFVINFSITDQKKLTLSTIKIKDLAAAESFAKIPQLQLRDQSNKQLKLRLETVSDYKLAKQVDLAVHSLATQQIIQSKNKLSKQSATNNKSNALIQVNSLTMLTYWWHNASPEEKQHFKQLIHIK